MYPKIYDVVEILLNNILDLNTNYPKSYDVVVSLITLSCGTLCVVY